jgi:drug/metabolite transporter (DMT)-like permease
MPSVASTPRERSLAYIAWIVICLVWGTTYLAIRVALESVPVALLAGLRWIAAGLMMIAALRVMGQALPHPRQWGSIAIAGFLLIVIGNGGVVWAEQYVTSGLAAVLVAMVPFWSVLIEALSPGGERPNRLTLLGLAIGFGGIVVLVWPELFVTGGGGAWFIAGVIALQLACLGWALGTVYTKRQSGPGSAAAASAVQMVLSGVIFIVIATATGEWDRLTFTRRSATALIYLAVFGSVIAYSAYLYALKHLAVATVSLYSYVNPIIAVVLGTLLLSEPFSSRTLVASALVLAGIAVVRSAIGHASGKRQEAA